jgi:pullulanase
MSNDPSNCAVDLVIPLATAAQAGSAGVQYATDAARDHPAATPLRWLSENVFSSAFRRAPALLLALAVNAAWAQSPETAKQALRTDCEASANARVLHAQAGPTAEARAYWLDRQTVQWPGAAAEGRFRLYYSAKAALRAAPGKAVSGADGFVELSLINTELAPAIVERFKFIAAGPRLGVPRNAAVAARLREQTLLVREDPQGRVLDATALQAPGALDDLYAVADKATLGAFRYGRPDISEDFATRFALWAPTARAVALCTYADGASARSEAYPARRDETNGVWTVDLPGALHGTRYLFLIDVYVPGVGIVRNRVTDPYSIGLTANSKHSVVLDLEHPTTQPEGWANAARPAALASNVDMSIYELHVRDFSRDDASVRPQWRGKYLGFTERDSKGMRHLRALANAGMTDVHLLPTYDLGSVPETGCINPQIPKAAANSEAQQAAVAAVADKDCYNWGYDPFHYDVPEGSYAVEPDGAARIREFRAMVQALHSAGLRVGLDVVYNHTFASGQDAKSVLDRIVPGYYHRLDATGKVERSTCCDNTATEHRMMAKLMIDSAVHWVKHYRIDSFRFDLMGHQPRSAMKQLQRAVDAAAGRRVNLIGEGWNFGEVANGARFFQASQLSLRNSGIGTFSDRARDALRGGGCCDSGEGLVLNQGWLNGLHYAPNAMNRSTDGKAKDRRAELLRAADLARIGLAGTLGTVRMTGADGVERSLAQFDYAGQSAGYVAEPGEVVNYVENHDNLTLFDLNALRLPRETSREDRARVQMLGAANTAFSQGVAYYHAGIEILRSKSLDKNSFNSGDAFNRLDWTYTDNGFAAGLPPKPDNGKDWPAMKTALADTNIKPTPREIAWMRDAFNDVLKIRASSRLFRMRSAADVNARLSFRNIGPQQNPLVLSVHLDGRAIGNGTAEGKPYDGAGFREILYFINASPEAQTLTLAQEAGKRYVLHPVQRAANAADARPKQARYETASGQFTIPGRSAVVYVVE